VKKSVQKKIHTSMYISIPALVIVDGLSILSINACRRNLSDKRYVNMPITIPVNMSTCSRMQITAASKPRPALIQ